MNNNTMEICKFISISEACSLTNIGRNTMLKLAKLKGFPALRTKKKYYIDPKELPIWLSKNYGVIYKKIK